MNKKILEIAKTLNIESGIDVTTDGDLELVIPILKTDGVSIFINIKIEEEFLNLKIESNNLGDDCVPLMEFFYEVNNYFMRNIGDITFHSSLNLVVSVVEIHLPNKDFIAKLIDKTSNIFNNYKYAIVNIKTA